MNYLQENWACIRAKQSHLLQVLDTEPDNRLEFIPARSGAVSAKLNNCYLHSQFDPVKEAQNLIRGKIHNAVSAAVFFGFGLGYHIEAFLQSFPAIPILIFEPDPPLFLKILESRSLAKILGNSNVRIVAGKKSDIIEEIQKLPLSNIQIIKLRSVYEKDLAFYNELDKAIQGFLAKKEININTLNRFGRLWVKNLVKNMELLLTMPGIICLEDFFKGIPALVLASGPSLDEIWKILPALQQRLLIIAVDTSLNACLQRGVEPDFIVVVDPQYWNTRHLDRAYPETGYLVSESSTHPRIFTSLKRKGFFASSFFPLGSYFESVTGYKGKIGAGGSVATSAWDFARLAGCIPLYIAGLDLGFPAKKTHFHGAFFEERFHTLCSRLATAETMSFAYIKQANPYYAEANDGGRVLTDKRMAIYKSWFETQAILYPGAKTYNLSRTGLKIGGMALAAAAELAALPVIREEIRRRMHEINNFFSTAGQDEKREQLKASLKDLTADLEVLEKQAKRGLQQTAEIRKTLAGNRTPAKALENLDKIDREILMSGSRIIAGFLLQPVIQRIINGTSTKQSPPEAIAAGEEIYRELRDSAAYHRALLQKAYQRL